MEEPRLQKVTQLSPMSGYMVRCAPRAGAPGPVVLDDASPDAELGMMFVVGGIGTMAAPAAAAGVMVWNRCDVAAATLSSSVAVPVPAAVVWSASSPKPRPKSAFMKASPSNKGS